MNEKPVIIIGNGGHAKVLVEILHLLEREIIGFTTPTYEENETSIPYLGNDDIILEYKPCEIELINALGSISNTEHRKNIYDYFKSKNYSFSTLVHPKGTIANNVEIGEGVQIMAGAVVQPFVKIADNSIINTSVSIDHDCKVGKHCHIAPGTNISGMVTIGHSSHIGTGSTIIQDIVIGNNVLIGAGSLVLQNINSGSKAYGVPAKEV